MNTRFVNGIAIIDVDGPISLGASADELSDVVGKLLDGNHHSILLNLANSPYFDSPGLGTLISSYSSAVRRGGRIGQLNPGERILQLLHVTRAGSLFDVSHDENSSVQNFQSRDIARNNAHLKEFLAEE